MRNAIVFAVLLALPQLALACSGTPAMHIDDLGSVLSARISGLEGCEGVQAELRHSDCSGEMINSCTVLGRACRIEFSPPWEPGQYAYAYCIDADNDGTYDIVASEKVGYMEPAEPERDSSLLFSVLAIVAIIMVMLYLLKRKAPKRRPAKRRRKKR